MLVAAKCQRHLLLTPVSETFASALPVIFRCRREERFFGDPPKIGLPSQMAGEAQNRPDAQLAILRDVKVGLFRVLVNAKGCVIVTR